MTEQERRELIQRNQRQREINMKWLPATMALEMPSVDSGATPIYSSPFRSSTPRYSPRSPNRQFEDGQRASSNKSRTQSINEWLQDFQSNRANVPGQYMLGREPSPRNTSWDDEPPEEVLTQIRAMNAIKDGNALIGKYNSLNNLNVPLSNRENDMGDILKTSEAFRLPTSFGTQQGRGDLYQGSRIGFGGPNDALTRFQAGKDKYKSDRQRWQSLQDSQIAERREGMGFGGQKFMGEDSIGKYLDQNRGYNPEDDMRDSLRFDLGKGGGGDDKTDWLGWAGIGTGLLQGAGGIMDYFANMRGLELTEQAMNKKYAADDRNYLAQATSLNNVIDTRKDFINKTQGGRNTDFLQRIPV